MPKGYTTKQHIANYLGIALADLLIDVDESGDGSQVDEWIAEIEAYIEKKTGRNFMISDESGDENTYEKKFDGDGSHVLIIADAISIDSVKIGDGENMIDESGDTSLYFYPANRTHPDQPITRIEGAYFPKGRQNIKITGLWGYSIDVPDDIRLIATVLVAGIVNFSNTTLSEGRIQSMSIGRYSVSYKNDTQEKDFERVPDIISYYKRFSF